MYKLYKKFVSYGMGYSGDYDTEEEALAVADVPEMVYVRLDVVRELREDLRAERCRIETFGEVEAK